MKIPKETKQNLGLTQPYLVFQVYVPQQGEVSLEVGTVCCSRNRRRILFSGVQKTFQVTTLLATVPLVLRGKDMWINLCIDFVDLVSGFWKGETYRSLESVTVTGTCRLKRIFTLNDNVVHTNDPAVWERLFLGALPKQCQLPNFLHQTVQYLSTVSLDYEHKSKLAAEQEYDDDDYGFGDKNQPKFQTLTDRFISAVNIKGIKHHNPQRQSCGDFTSLKESNYYLSNELNERKNLNRKPVVIKTKVGKTESRQKMNEKYPKCDDLTSKAVTGKSMSQESHYNNSYINETLQSNISTMKAKDLGCNISNLLLVGTKMTPTEISECEVKQINQKNRQCSAIQFYPPVAQRNVNSARLQAFKSSSLCDYIGKMNEANFTASDDDSNISIENTSPDEPEDVSGDIVWGASKCSVNNLSDNFSDTTDNNNQNMEEILRFSNEEADVIDQGDFISKSNNYTTQTMENYDQVVSSLQDDSCSEEVSVRGDGDEKIKQAEAYDFMKTFARQMNELGCTADYMEDDKFLERCGDGDASETSYYNLELGQDTSCIIKDRSLGVDDLEDTAELGSNFKNAVIITEEFECNDESANDEITKAVNSFDIETLRINCEISEQESSPEEQEQTDENVSKTSVDIDSISSCKTWLLRNFLDDADEENE